MDSYRDWGHSYDYVRAMWKIINHEVPDDFVVSSMDTHSVRELCNIVFKQLGLDYREYVTQNPKYLRPEELPYLCGDSTKARNILGWKPEYTFDRMIKEMVNYWLEELS
jgi:GDPmannose 4,6-dehydratase